MKIPLSAIAACATISLTALHGAEKPAVPFRDLTLDAALKTAAAEQKLVFVDFYTTWCGPCKMLDAQTWTNADVGKLVGEHAVALRLDAEKEGEAAATHYKVDVYPTLLLLKPDGTEMDRLVGFREPAVFMTEFSSSLHGKTSMVRAQEAVAEAGDKVTREQVLARQKLAQEFTQNGKYEEALREDLWLYDVGMKQVSSFAGVRTSFLTSAMGRLANEYPPAADALRVRRDDAKTRLLAGDRLAGLEFAALNEALGEGAANLALFDELPAGDPRRRAIGMRLYKDLVEARRYKDALEVQPFESMVRMLDMMTRVPDNARPEVAAARRNYVLENGSLNVEVLAGAGDLDHARVLCAKVLAIDSSDAAKAQLREGLARAGHEELLADRKPQT